MLSDADVAAMRLTINASLPSSCDIGRYVGPADGSGGQTVTWPVAAGDTGVDCRIAPTSETLRRTEEIAGEKLVSRDMWIVTFASTVDLTEKDHLTIGSKTYEIAAVFGQSSWDLCTRALCSLVS